MKVIIAIDQTDYWKQVIDGVIKRCWPDGTSFKIMTVIEPLQWQDHEVGNWQNAAQHALKQRQEQSDTILAEARELVVKVFPDCQVHTESREGSPRVEILRAATEWMADKIVLGAHGHSPNRFFPGAVPRTVCMRAVCSVELVRLTQLEAVEKQQKYQRKRIAVL